MKKVLYISYDGMTDPLGQSQVLPYVMGLSKKGYAITILSFEKPARLAADGHIIRKIIKEGNVKWEPMQFTARPPVISKMYDRWRLKRKALQLFRKNNFDIIHCRSYVAAEAGLLLKEKYNCSFLFDMRGFWADEKVDAGRWDLSKALYRRIYAHYKKMENKFLLSANAVVSLTQAAKNYLHTQPGYADIPITVIPCCVDLEHFNSTKVDIEETALLKKNLGIDASQKVITYLGSIGGWYMVSEMFLLFKVLLERYPEFVLLFITRDNPKEVMDEIAVKGIDPSKVFIQSVSREHMPLYLSLSDASVFFIRPTFSKTASSPTKHAELMGMGIPVICNEIGDTGNIIRQDNTGIVTNTFDEETLISITAQMDSLLALDKKNIRESAYHHFNLVTGIERYAAVYQSIARF